MENVSVRVDAETIESVEREATDAGLSRAAYLREIIENRHESDEYETEISRLNTEIDRLKREKRQILDQREENKQLRRYVETEQTNAEKRRQAGLPTRVKWFLFGDRDETEG
jgi:chromosome segregation ATPase